MDVKDIMNREVKTIGPEETVQRAAEIMTKFGIGSIVVVSGDRMAGILTERDIMKLVAKEKNIDDIKVKTIMTNKVVFISPATDIYDAAEIMAKNKIKKLPVITGNNLIGIVTATDLVAAEPKLLDAIGKLMLFKRKKFVAG